MKIWPVTIQNFKPWKLIHSEGNSGYMFISVWSHSILILDFIKNRFLMKTASDTLQRTACSIVPLFKDSFKTHFLSRQRRGEVNILDPVLKWVYEWSGTRSVLLKSAPDYRLASVLLSECQKMSPLIYYWHPSQKNAAQPFKSCQNFSSLKYPG